MAKFKPRRSLFILLLTLLILVGVWGIRTFHSRQKWPNGEGVYSELDETWVDLCYTRGIGNSEMQMRAHSPLELIRQLGSEMGRLVSPSVGDKWSTDIVAKEDRLPEARTFMLGIATRYGYILKFKDGTSFDPRSISGWKPEKWALDEEEWSKLNRRNPG